MNHFAGWLVRWMMAVMIFGCVVLVIDRQDRLYQKRCVGAEVVCDPPLLGALWGKLLTWMEAKQR